MITSRFRRRRIEKGPASRSWSLAMDVFGLRDGITVTPKRFMFGIV